MRNCQKCHKPLARKKHQSGRREDMTAFNRRTHCDRICARPVKTVKTKERKVKTRLLNDAQEREIFRAHDQLGATIDNLAAVYQVSAATIKNAINRASVGCKLSDWAVRS